MTSTTASLVARVHDGGVRDPDPAGRPKRRTFSAEFKARILAEYDALATGSPERGVVLRREGLYSSHLAEWRKARDVAIGDGLAPKVRGAKRTPERVELDPARKRIEGLEAELARTRLALELTGKAHALLEMLSESADTERRSKP